MVLKNVLHGFFLFMALGLAACASAGPVALTPAPENTQVEKSPIPTTTAVATATLTASSTATPTVEPTTSATFTPEATQVPLSPVITLENLSQLASMPLTLPEYPQRLLWVSPGVMLPTGLMPTPNLLAFTDSMMYPVSLNPPTAGQPVKIAVPGRVLDYSSGLISAAAVPDSSTSQVVLYDLAGNPIVTIPDDAAYGASYSPDGSLLAVTSQNELAVNLYNTASGQLVKKLTGFQTAAPVYSVGIVPGNKTIYWIARATLEFQDVQSGQMGQKLNYQDFIVSEAFSPDGSRLVLCVSGKLLLYSVPDAQKLAEVTLSQPLTSISFSTDGRLLATNYGSGIQLWNAATLSPVTTLAGPNTSTGAVAFSPDGRYLVSQHENNVIDVWRVK
jgi:hypothetical protein